MILLYLTAGTRTVRGTKRTCLLRLELVKNVITSASLRDDVAEESALVVPITFQAFRKYMQEHRLSFRRTRYTTDEERKEAHKKALAKYRKSAKFKARQLLRRKRHPTPGVITAEDVQRIKQSTQPRMKLSRYYGISLRMLDEVCNGQWEEGGVLVGNKAMGA